VTRTSRLWTLVALILMTGCEGDLGKGSPIAPLATFPGLLDEGNFNLSAWPPYVVVHTPGNALAAYRKAIPELMASGALKGARIGIYKVDGFNNQVNQWIASVVPDVLWLLGNYYLFDPNIEQVIDQAVSRYPGIKYLQIGNEITTILPENGPQIPIEMYMEVLKRIYDYVQLRYPGIILVSQPTFGAGSPGSQELERMIELGLKDMLP